MALSLKEKLNAQMEENMKGYEESVDKKEKPAEKPEAKTSGKQVKETKSAAKTEEKPVQKMPEGEKTKVESSINSNVSAMSFDEWKKRVMHAVGDPDPDKKRVYKSIVVGVDNWEYVDEKAKELTDASRKFTHNEYMELLIKDAVSRFNSLSDDERAAARVMEYDSKKHINKAKLVAMEEKYWDALDQLRMVYRGMTKCDLINMIIDEDVAKAHPHREEVTKITL